MKLPKIVYAREMQVAPCILWCIFWGMRETVTPRRTLLIIFLLFPLLMSRILFCSFFTLKAARLCDFSWSLLLLSNDKRGSWVKTKLWALGYVLWGVFQMDSWWSFFAFLLSGLSYIHFNYFFFSSMIIYIILLLTNQVCHEYLWVGPKQSSLLT